MKFSTACGFVKKASIQKLKTSLREEDGIVDQVKSFPTSLCSRNLASIPPRASPLKGCPKLLRALDNLSAKESSLGGRTSMRASATCARRSRRRRRASETSRRRSRQKSTFGKLQVEKDLRSPVLVITRNYMYCNN